MPTLTLTFPTGSHPTAVVLTALTRTDTGASVSFGGGAFAESSPGSGVWSVTWTAPAVGLSYHWYALATIGGVAAPLDGVKVDGVPDTSYTGRYTSTAAIRTFMGPRFADVSSSGSESDGPDQNAYAQAVKSGEAELDQLAAGGSIAIPMATAVGSAARDIVETDARGLAVWWLHYKFPSKGETQNNYDKLREAILARWAAWRDDPTLLPPGFTLNPNGFNPGVLAAPAAIYATVDKDGRATTPSNQRRGVYWDGPGIRYRW